MRLRLLSVLALIGSSASAQACSGQADAPGSAKWTANGFAAPRPRPPQPTTVTGVSWRLASGIDVRGWRAFAPSLHFDGGRVSGTSGCNSFFGRYTLDGETLTIGRLATTRMACGEPERSVEAAYRRGLERAAGVRLDAGALRLLDAAGNEVLRFEVARPVGTWVVTSLRDGSTVVSLPEGAKITLRFSGGRLTGTSGCNTYRTTYTAGLAHLRIREPVSTRKSCGRPAGVMALERRFLRQLPTTAAYTIDGWSMRLARRSGSTVAFLARED